MLDGRELELLQASQRSGGESRLQLRVVVSGCAYTCCGRGWLRRDGREQEYCGYVTELREGTGFVLTNPGLGTISYMVAVAMDEVQLVEEA